MNVSIICMSQVLCVYSINIHPLFWNNSLSRPASGHRTLGYLVLGLPRRSVRVQELCESQGGCPGLSVLMSLTVYVDVKQHWTMLRHWSQFVSNTSTDIRGHEALLHHHQKVCDVNGHPRTWSSTSSSSSEGLWCQRTSEDMKLYFIIIIRRSVMLGCQWCFHEWEKAALFGKMLC